jgi:hypothetical protein
MAQKSSCSGDQATGRGASRRAPGVAPMWGRLNFARGGPRLVVEALTSSCPRTVGRSEGAGAGVGGESRRML